LADRQAADRRRLRQIGQLSQDGREIALELQTLSEEAVLCRLPDGEWALEGAAGKN
jgi:hypothetical protein